MINFFNTILKLLTWTSLHHHHHHDNNGHDDHHDYHIHDYYNHHGEVQVDNLEESLKMGLAKVELACWDIVDSATVSS